MSDVLFIETADILSTDCCLIFYTSIIFGIFFSPWFLFMYEMSMLEIDEIQDWELCKMLLTVFTFRFQHREKKFKYNQSSVLVRESIWEKVWVVIYWSEEIVKVEWVLVE